MNNKDRLLWVMGISMIVIMVGLIVFGFYMVNLLRETADQALAPIEQANAEIRTKVADLLNPTPTIIPDPVSIIRDIRALARLETIEYSVEKVITAEIGQNEFAFLFGDRLLFVAHGVVIAGIDLSRLENDSLWLDGGDIYINMPPPEIFIAALDNDKSYVYDRQRGMLTKGDQNLETQARQVAEREIEKTAIEDGILELAKKNAELFLEQFIQAMGFDDVIFMYPLGTD